MFTRIGRTLVGCLCLTALLASPQPAAAQASPTRIVNTQIPFALTIVNPCTLESVDINGLGQLTIFVNADSNGGIHLKISSVTKGTGVGQITLTNYAFSENTEASANFAPGQQQEATFSDKLRLRGAKALDNYDVKTLTHVTVNADGSITAFVDNFTSVCRG